MFAYINKNNIVYLKLKFICKNSSTWTTINMNKIISLQLLLISAKWKYTDVTTADTIKTHCLVTQRKYFWEPSTLFIFIIFSLWQPKFPVVILFLLVSLLLKSEIQFSLSSWSSLTSFTRRYLQRCFLYLVWQCRGQVLVPVWLCHCLCQCFIGFETPCVRCNRNLISF